MEKLTHDVMGVTIRLPHGEKISFYAGQYINIVLEDGQRRASPSPVRRTTPSTSNCRSAWCRAALHHPCVRAMKVGDALRFEGPLGDSSRCASRAGRSLRRRRHRLRAGEEHGRGRLPPGLKRPMWLYWGVRRPRTST
jgi:CDP-4-dehydro-6-deoxyglucose reductase